MILERKDKSIGEHSPWTKRRVDWKIYLPPVVRVSLEASYLNFKRRVFLDDEAIYKGEYSLFKSFDYKWQHKGRTLRIREPEHFRFEIEVEPEPETPREWSMVMPVNHVGTLESMWEDLKTIRIIDETCRNYQSQ